MRSDVTKRERPSIPHGTLAERVRAGDAEAFSELFLTFGDPLRRFAFRHVRSSDLADDVVQDVFSSIWHARERIDLRVGLRAYLFRATRNRALDILDHEAVCERWASESGLLAGHIDSYADAEIPDDGSRDIALLGIIDVTLDRMPARRQLVCRLRWKDGVSLTEIARRLALSTKTIETQITRGRRDLRAALSETAYRD